MRAATAAPSFLVLISCVTLFPHSASAQISERLERCIPTPTFEREVLDASVQGAVPTVVVDDVTFDGPNQMPAAERAALVKKLKAMRVTNDGEGLAEQQNEVRRWWQDAGYYRAEFRIQAIPKGLIGTQQHVSLEIHVDEGQQFRTGTVNFRSYEPDEPLVFSQTQLKQLVTLRDGDVFSAASILATLDALRKLYASRGHIDFVATPITEINEATHRIDLMMELDQQKPYRIGSVYVRAASPKVRETINAQVKPGDVLDYSIIPKLLKQNASLLPPDISERDVRLERDTTLGIVNLWFELEPCPQAAPQ
jgi:outer membrane protein assembly factor BamA